MPVLVHQVRSKIGVTRRTEEAELLSKVSALESEKQQLAENVTSLQSMLASMQHHFAGMGGNGLAQPASWGPSPDENQNP